MKLTIGGSPCTHWSIAQTKNRETEPSGIGWELFENYLIALDKFKPDYFLYENNKSMAPAIRTEITKRLGVEPICINSALVSAQNRKRLYWTNIPGVQQPEDRGILLRDILETTWSEKGYELKEPWKLLTDQEMEYMVRETSGGRNHFDFDYHHDATTEKSQCVTANTHRGVPYNVLLEPVNTTEAGKAQCMRATYYKDGIRNMVGNTVDRKTCVAEPVRIGTIESEAKNADFDSQQYRVYSPDGKSVTLCDHEAAKRLTDAGVLLPCPFCGKAVTLRRVSSSYTTSPTVIMDSWTVECPNGCVRNNVYKSEIFQDDKGEVVIKNNGADEARLAWNTRAPILSAEEMEMLEGLE